MHPLNLTNPQASGELALPVTAGMTDGTYFLSSFTTTDQEGRIASYRFDGFYSFYESLHGWTMLYDYTDYDFSDSHFLVKEARTTPPAAPRFVSLTREGGGDVSIGGTIRYAYTTTTEEYPVRTMQIRISGPYGASQTFVSEGGTGTFVIPVTAEWISGPYSPVSIILTDTAGRTATITYGTQAINVRGTDVDPYFRIQPAALTSVGVGGYAELTASGVGLGPVTYQWYRGEPGDTSVPVAGDSFFTGTARLFASVTQPTTFWVRLTSAGQTADSHAARVIPVPPPAITQQPSAQVVAIGDTANFTVGATGTGTLRYQWSGGAASSVARDRPTFSFPVTGAENAGDITCEVTDIGGTTRTLPARLTVIALANPLQLTAEPVDAIVSAGAETTGFAATFIGNPPLVYRWQKNGVDLPNSGSTSLRASSERSTLTIRNPTVSDIGKYRFVISNAYETLYSREVDLRVAEAPVITLQPAATYTAINAISLEVVAAGRPPFTYQWRRNGIPLPAAFSRNLNLYSLSSADSGDYDVVVTNASGSVTSNRSQVTLRPLPEFPRITRGPANLTARPGDTVTFTIERIGGEQCIWYKASRILQAGNETSFTLRNVGSSDSGQYRVLVGSPTGSATTADFTLTVAPAQDAPRITRPPVDTVAMRGSLTSLNVAADGRAPFQIQWRRNGVPMPRADSGYYGHDETTLYFSNFSHDWAGSYDVVITNGAGSVTSAPVRLSLPPPGPEGRLMNVSVRASAGGPSGPLIVGFVLGGGVSETVPLLVRAAGPALEAFGVTGVLGNPSATLYTGSSPRYTNDDWSGLSQTATTAARVGAFPFSAPARDAAFASSLVPGAYTVHVTGFANTSGVALAEIYDATPAAEINLQRPRLLNLSVQTSVSPGAPVIAGFVLGGTQPRKVLVRAIGPSLAGFGVQGALADPQLALRSSDTLVASNDDWAGDTSVSDAATASGAFTLSSTESKDAALVTTLAPGSYTAQVTGAASASGLVLVEVYEVP